MIVRDRGDSWQVVMQTDHADLSAEFARTWAEVRPRHESLTIATERHDDGWAVWEQSPRVDADGTPVNFLDVDVRSHLAFYRAGIAAVGEQDLYAGLLVSMHGAGIYRQRYGRDPALGLSRAQEVQGLVDAFVDEQEAGYEERIAELSAGATTSCSRSSTGSRSTSACATPRTACPGRSRCRGSRSRASVRGGCG